MVALGGITADNGALLVAAGADLLAVISDVFGQADIRAAAARLRLPGIAWVWGLRSLAGRASPPAPPPTPGQARPRRLVAPGAPRGGPPGRGPASAGSTGSAGSPGRIASSCRNDSGVTCAIPAPTLTLSNRFSIPSSAAGRPADPRRARSVGRPRDQGAGGAGVDHPVGGDTERLGPPASIRQPVELARRVCVAIDGEQAADLGGEAQ